MYLLVFTITLLTAASACLIHTSVHIIKLQLQYRK